MSVKAMIDSGDDGWGEYTLGPDGNRAGAELVSGDVVLGNKICQSTNYKTGQYIRMVISFDDNLSPKKAKEIHDEFFELFLTGYGEDEVHKDTVFHTDTDYPHFHDRIPKLNLHTQTQLKIYNHKTDVNRIEAIKDYLNAKHNLIPPVEQDRPVIEPNKKDEIMNKWRKEHAQKPFDFKEKKDRDIAAMQVQDTALAVVDNLQPSSLDELINYLNDAGVNIINQGYDKGKRFHYITIQNDSGSVRVKGNIFSDKFFTQGEDPIKDLSILEKNLDKFQEKRILFIEKTYKNSRKKALIREKNLLAEAHAEAKLNPIERKTDGENSISEEDRRSEENRARVAAAARTGNRRRSVVKLTTGTEQRVEEFVRSSTTVAEPTATTVNSGADSNRRRSINLIIAKTGQSNRDNRKAKQRYENNIGQDINSSGTARREYQLSQRIERAFAGAINKIRRIGRIIEEIVVPEKPIKEEVTLIEEEVYVQPEIISVLDHDQEEGVFSCSQRV